MDLKDLCRFLHRIMDIMKKEQKLINEDNSLDNWILFYRNRL